MDITGNWVGAVAEYQKALDLAERLGNVTRQNELKLNLGILHTKQGNSETAFVFLSESLELARSHDLRTAIVLAQSSIADLQIRLCNWEAAEGALAFEGTALGFSDGNGSFLGAR